MIAAVNVIAADTEDKARQQLLTVQRRRVGWLLGRGRDYTDAEADQILASPPRRHVTHTLRYRAVGTPKSVKEYLDGFAVRADADADELIVAHQSPSIEQRLRSVELLADTTGLAEARPNAGN